MMNNEDIVRVGSIRNVKRCLDEFMGFGPRLRTISAVWLWVVRSGRKISFGLKGCRRGITAIKYHFPQALQNAAVFRQRL